MTKQTLEQLQEYTERCYKLLESELELNIIKNNYIESPNVEFKNKRTRINNIDSIATSLNRDLIQILNYMQNELKATISVTSDKCFIIIGNFKKHNIEKVLKNYIILYIQCKMCKSLNTTYEREHKINFLCCNNCKAKRSILLSS